jgi:hypothetical protein
VGGRDDRLDGADEGAAPGGGHGPDPRVSLLDKVVARPHADDLESVETRDAASRCSICNPIVVTIVAAVH